MFSKGFFLGVIESRNYVVELIYPPILVLQVTTKLTLSHDNLNTTFHAIYVKQKLRQNRDNDHSVPSYLPSPPPSPLFLGTMFFVSFLQPFLQFPWELLIAELAYWFHIKLKELCPVVKN